MTARAGRFAQTLVCSSLATCVVWKRLGALGASSRVLAVVFTMGNKQTVFTHEQLEAYQVGVMGWAHRRFGSLGFLAWEVGAASFVSGVQSARVPGAALCAASGRDGCAVGGRGRGPLRQALGQANLSLRRTAPSSQERKS